jgi:hypothetical protein
MLGNSIIATRNVIDLSITGAKLETIGAASTIGDSDLFIISYDTKGRVTSASANYAIVGALAGDLLQYNGAGWVNFTPNYTTGTGTADYVSRWTSATVLGDSIIRDNGTTVGVNVAPSGFRQFYVNATAVGISTCGYFGVSGANATNVGLRGDATNGTNISLGVYGNGGAVVSFPKASGNAGILGTGYTTGAIEAFGGFFVVDTDVLATADTFGVYIDAQNSGTGRAYGFVVENGKCLIGAAASTVDSAILELVSTTQGLRLPVMTTAQKNAIVAPMNGLMVYDSTLQKACVYTTAWETITSV